MGACLSLTGKYARFGRQAAQGLRAWQALDPGADVRIEDDGSEPDRVAPVLAELAAECDLLLGPYSSELTRAAAAAVRGMDGLLWNHGGAADDVQSSAPGALVSVLTPATRYARPFLLLAARQRPTGPLVVVPGRGRFGRQVTAGARVLAEKLGVVAIAGRAEGPGFGGGTAEAWDLLCAGSFEEDVKAVRWARGLPRPPRSICAVAAGVQEFGSALSDPEGVHGMAQWFPGTVGSPDLGPSETELLGAYAALGGSRPDYPAIQAAAAAGLAVACARRARTTARDALWQAACTLDVRTLFGRFRIDPATGLQLGHETVLVRWGERGLEAAV